MALEVVVADLSSSDSATRSAALVTFLDHLVESGPVESASAAAPLAAMLRSEADAAVRHDAAFALGELRRHALGSVDALIHAARGDADADVRARSLEALARVASPNLGVVARCFEPNPEDPSRLWGDSYVRARDAALAATLDSLKDDAATVRKEALRALENWGKEVGASLAEYVVPLAQDEDSDVRHACVHALYDMRAPSAVTVEAILQVLRLGDTKSWNAARSRRCEVRYLERLGAAARTALPVLRELQHDPETADAAEAAIQAIEADTR